MGNKVVKFGGSSLADAGQFAKVREIIRADAARLFVVPSAPGKRFSDDVKVTDMLYESQRLACAGEDFGPVFDRICQRYRGIARDLGLQCDLEGPLQKVREDLAAGADADYAASRGEFLNGILLADYLGFPFVDAAELIVFDEAGNFLPEETQKKASAVLKDYTCAVVPGFYGAKRDGTVKTFSRGGSDITGAIVARAIDAALYENWTDVSGFLMADPRIVKNPETIDYITYRELRELSYMGASVLHEEAIFPVRLAGIPINIKNTNAPDHPGTMIMDRFDEAARKHTVTGIAGHKGFTVITIEKEMMNTERGFGRKVLSVLEKFDISFEHIPSSIDTLSVVIADAQLGDNLDAILTSLHEAVSPDALEVSDNMALIATVGHGMVRQRGVAAKLFDALVGAGVNVRMIDQGSSEMNIIVGVESDDFDLAVRAIYEAFVTA